MPALALAELRGASWRRCAPGGPVAPAARSRAESRFLASHPEFERLDAAAILAGRCENLKLEGPYVQLRPDLHGTDGFFAAVFERKKAGANGAGCRAVGARGRGEMDDASPQAGQDAGAPAAAEQETA